MSLSSAQRLLNEIQQQLREEQARKERAHSTIGFYDSHDTMALAAPNNTAGYQVMLPLKCPIDCPHCQEEREREKE